MDTSATYSFTQDGIKQGPYLRCQIASMIASGAIKADAYIELIEDPAKNWSVSSFLDTMSEQEALRPVVVRDVSLSMEAIFVIVFRAAVVSAFLGFLVWLGIRIVSAIIER